MTQHEAVQLAIRAIGTRQVKAHGYINPYRAQCLAFIAWYTEQLGYGSIMPGYNAIDVFLKNPLKLKKPAAPQPGDMFFMDYYADGINYGHTGVVVEVTASGFYSVDQNWYTPSLTVGSPAAKVFHMFNQVRGYLRPEYKEEIVLEEQPPVFNPVYYLKINPDVAKAGKNSKEYAKQHWLKHGIKEGRASAPNFHVKEYLANYADLRKAYGDKGYAKAVKHYYQLGINEGRSGRTVKTELNPVGKALQAVINQFGTK